MYLMIKSQEESPDLYSYMPRGHSRVVSVIVMLNPEAGDQHAAATCMPHCVLSGVLARILEIDVSPCVRCTIVAVGRSELGYETTQGGRRE